MANQEISKISSRRDWFTGSAALLGAGALTSVIARAQQSPQTIVDINVMNSAIRLENLEAAFFQQGVASFIASDFQNSVAGKVIGGSLAANMYSYISAIAENEQSHVATLIQTIYSLDSPPLAPDCYNFGFTTPDSFLQMAQTIENLGVTLYNGVIIPQFVTSNSTVNNPPVQALMATLATVEARHAAYFNLINQAIPFPAPFDSAQTMAQFLSAIAPYLTTGCNAPPVPLTLAVAGPAKNTILTTNQNVVALDASLSTSASGKLTYLWQQDLGSSPMQIVNVTAPLTSAILQGAGNYVISLKVTDALGGSDQDTLRIIRR